MIAASNLARFMAVFGAQDLEDLQRRSTEDPEWFWHAVIVDLDIRFYEPYSKVLDMSAGIQWPKWCVDGRLNIIHNCIDKRRDDDRPAIKWEGEDGSTLELSYRQLAQEVNRFANALRRLGVKKGDVVALFMPMLPETAIAMFAIAKIGGIVLPLFSGYGADALATRLVDSEAICLITCDGYQRRGRTIEMKKTADDAVERSPSVRHVVVVRRCGVTVGWRGERDRWWKEIVASESLECDSEQTAAEDSLMLIYTSGTTGRPKGTLHTHCGFPIKAAQDLSHGFDLKAQDTIFWVTDIGWMMGPWELFGATIIGATVVLYDGAFDYPDPERIWNLVKRHRVSVLGVSPTLIRLLMRHADRAVDLQNSALRILGSTGETWDLKSWRWFFEKVGGSCLPIINYSGGTEISGGILSGNVLTPMKPCAFAGPLPGMAADVVDESGTSVRNQVGELVIRGPWIGMSRGFWKDPERYLQTYWSKIKDVWVHGDWAAVDTQGFWYITGRSDDTIKVAGKRVGPAEVESLLVQHPGVVEAAVIGIPDELKGQAIVCFCVTSTDIREESLTDLVVGAFGRSLRPLAINYVEELPRTRNGKVMRRVIRAAFLGEEEGDTSALENPNSVPPIRTLGIPYRRAAL